jgi:hypothetical protein
MDIPSSIIAQDGVDCKSRFAVAKKEPPERIQGGSFV